MLSIMESSKALAAMLITRLASFLSMSSCTMTPIPVLKVDQRDLLVGCTVSSTVAKIFGIANHSWLLS
jgi:hypothetical protein